MKKIPIVICLLGACTGGDTAGGRPTGPPPDVPPTLRPIIGEYANEADTLSVLEEGGSLTLLFWRGERLELTTLTDTTFETASAALVATRTGSDGRNRGVCPSMAERSTVYPWAPKTVARSA